MSTAKEQLEALSKRLRESALVYRSKADTQDRYACFAEVLVASSDDDSSKKSLAYLMEKMPSWFPS